MSTAWIPKPGEWPVDPQEDIPIRDDRIWIDGCFDFFHHGHAGVMLQARQLGTELLVGLHSDEDIREHKGPTVMNLAERVSAAEACRWVTRAVPYCPYVTDLTWISHYGCQYVVHGDDITSDSGGEDAYRYVKKAGRFKVVKRTPGISTTDLVGRMLLCTKGHFIKSLKNTLQGAEGNGSEDDRKAQASYMAKRMKDYASDETGLNPGVDVYFSHAQPRNHDIDSKSIFELYLQGKGRRPDQRIVYADGSFDLFSSGQIEFLKSVSKLEDSRGQQSGWFSEERKAKRIQEHGEDYGPAFVVVGIHDDEVINREKGLNYPIMNIFERGLCLLQCKHVHAVVFGAPFEPSKAFLQSFPYGLPNVVYHGPTSFMELDFDPYRDPKSMGLFEEIPRHDFQEVNAGDIVDRITERRAEYEQRQKKKGEKAVGEDAHRKKEDEANSAQSKAS